MTGATGAIGRAITLILASRGYSLLLACRNPLKGEALAKEALAAGACEAVFVRLDLTDSRSVREAVGIIGPRKPDGIVNNAGTMNGSFHVGPDGHEDTLNVNYHNTRLLTELLLPNLKRGSNIVFTTSATRRWYLLQPHEEDITESRFSRLAAYSLSKKLITVYARELSKRLETKGILVNCSDPGVVDSPILRMDRWFDRIADIVFRPLCFSPKTGAKAAVRALDASLTGRVFLAPCFRFKIPRKLFFR